MKKKFSILSLLLLSIWQNAVSQTIMNIYKYNGTVTQIPISEIDSITYTINDPGLPATLTTHPVTNITLNSALSGGNITSDDGAFSFLPRSHSCPDSSGLFLALKLSLFIL
jgi:hypothetical protein